MGDEHVGAVVDRVSGSVNAEEFTYRSAWLTGIAIACVCVVTLSGCVVAHLMDIGKESWSSLKDLCKAFYLQIKKRCCAKGMRIQPYANRACNATSFTRTEQEGGLS